MADSTNKRESLENEPRPEPLYRWFTPVPQEWFALVVRGGDLCKIVHGVKGWYVDTNDFEFKKEDSDHQNIISPIRALTGRDFVGIPGIQGLYRYKFAWNKYWRKDGTSPEYDIQAHDPEIVYFTPFENQYPLMFGGIEVIAKEEKGTGGNRNTADEALIPVTFVVTVRVRMTKPRIALMTNTDWFGGVLTPNMQKGIKNFAGDKTYDELIRGGKKQISENLKQYIMSGEKVGEPCEFKDNVLRDAGVEIIDIGITEIKPNAQFENALLDLAKAQREALASIVTAEGKKKARELEGEGDASYIDKVAEADERRIDKTTLKVARAGHEAVEAEKWRQLHGSGITTYFESGARAQPSILVGADGKPVS